MYKSDIADLQKELEYIKKNLDREKIKNAELEGWKSFGRIEIVPYFL